MKVEKTKNKITKKATFDKIVSDTFYRKLSRDFGILLNLSS